MIKDKNILFYFLKGSFSTRKIDEKIGFDPIKSKGWESWNVLKKYGLKNSDKGKLYIFSSTEAKRIIKKFLNNENDLDSIINDSEIALLKKYKNSYLLAKSEKDFVNIMSGETRNITRSFFITSKKLVGTCQYKGCRSTKLETAHFKKDRPQIFMNSAKKFRVEYDGLYKYNLYNVFYDFLLSHSQKKSICFLCKRHHNELDNKSTDRVSFSRNIIWND